MANNILRSYIPKFLVELNRANEDLIVVTTNYFSPDREAYVLDRRTVSPVLIQTTQSLQELKPEISTVYPVRAPMPLEYDGAVLLLSPTVNTEPTASQDYYTPIYFERYDATVIGNIDRSFTEFDAIIDDVELYDVAIDTIENETPPIV